MIEPSKFTYSLLARAFEIETKTIKDQGKKQIREMEENKKQLYNKQPGNNELLLSIEIEVFNNFYNKKLVKIHQLSKKN